jgi:hypothetical protein
MTPTPVVVSVAVAIMAFMVIVRPTIATPHHGTTNANETTNKTVIVEI